ncbi:MAG: hypothetical protein LR017_00280 [Candidatus Pacebacteria bacterium]|nr:hypothetical protein [Candidatus Paceibacterota bacterium]
MQNTVALIFSDIVYRQTLAGVVVCSNKTGVGVVELSMRRFGYNKF